MVRSETETVIPAGTTKIRTALFPLKVKFDSPGPEIVRFLEIVSWDANVMVAGYGRLKSIISPGAASIIACRRVPAPLSAVLLTVIVAAIEILAEKNVKSKGQINNLPISFLILGKILDSEKWLNDFFEINRK